ncbi:hypothetical protein CTI12_AA502340 [Artemisia annua]|uniref:AB hydrolase-1 domain-containing protein n=1 Tax=Artemisia annua TaxID=35608 RepID=A0A2U1LDL2_ARTAN|nr:hypothetical protein CTI12_AA502340 [Artemisia annua]
MNRDTCLSPAFLLSKALKLSHHIRGSPYFAHSLASSLSTYHASAVWRMVLVDLRNHGRTADTEGLSPPHDTINAARDIANLVKSLEWAWPDVVIGHSLGGKVALQYALSCALGDYGVSAQLPKQVWLLDAPPGKAENNSQYEEVKKALLTLKTVPSPIPSKEWLVDHLTSLGLSKFLSEWFGSSLKKSGEHETFSFNINGAIDMFESVVMEMDYWTFLEHPPKDIEIAIVRTDSKLTWGQDLVERLESLAKKSSGKVSVDVVPNSGHWIYRDQPQMEMDHWEVLEHPPKGTETATERTESQLSWAADMIERLESLAKRESDESTGKVSVDGLPTSGHYIYRDQPQMLLEIMTPRIASLVQLPKC